MGYGFSDDLVIFVRALLMQDLTIQSIFAANGLPQVSILAARQRTAAAYPRLILSAVPGKLMSTGDTLPKFYDGSLTIETVARESDVCPDPLGCCAALYQRYTDLLIGNRKLALPGVRGQFVSPQFNITVFRQDDHRDLPVTDNEFVRFETNYAVQLNRQDV